MASLGKTKTRVLWAGRGNPVRACGAWIRWDRACILTTPLPDFRREAGGFDAG